MVKAHRLIGGCFVPLTMFAPSSRRRHGVTGNAASAHETRIIASITTVGMVV
jgi:hypothetical protein